MSTGRETSQKFISGHTGEFRQLWRYGLIDDATGEEVVKRERCC